MKRLLWSVSLACFLPIVAEMPSQAAGNFNIIANPSTNLADSKATDSTDNIANLSDPFASAESLAPAQKIAVADPFGTVSQPVVAPVDNLENPLVTTKLAGKPNKRKAKTPTALKAAPASTQLQPAKAENTNLLSQSSQTTTDLDRQLGELNSQKFPVAAPNSQGFGLSPALSINNPVGFGADGGVGFLSGSYQSQTRGTTKSEEIGRAHV